MLMDAHNFLCFLICAKIFFNSVVLHYGSYKQKNIFFGYF